VDPVKPSWLRPVLVVVVIAAGIVAARALGLGEVIRLENLSRLKQWIESYGVLAPVIFIVGYILAAVLFVPGLPMTVLGGVVFGPVWGTAYVWIAATVGAALAFLVARYAVRSTVERWVQASPRIATIDGRVAEHGWRIVMLTRLVPVFPFNLQNYAYGITRIGFWPYVITSAICMLPGTAAFTFAGGALSEGRGVRRTLAYLALAGVLLVLISLIPRWLARRNRLAGELLKSCIVTALLAGANAYNLLAIKAVLDQYPTVSIKDGGSLFSPIWKKSIGAVGGTPYSLDAIEHGILRKAFREPRVHFAIVCASLSCPDLRPEPFVAARLGAQLDGQIAAFLGNPAKGLAPGADGRSARVSSIFKWFAGDFEGSGGVAAFIRAKAASDVAVRIRALTDAGLSYLDYDWSLNDTARVSS
jgi:uncharacterized membrane protein YdjX (TVP38/TMEM64 family)